MKKKRLILISSLVITIQALNYAQDNNSSLANGQMSQVGIKSIPVNLSTGTANINIPVGSMSAGGFNLPISLSYNTGGIRVDEDASQVGLGWILNAGGVINRNMLGIPDETIAPFSQEVIVINDLTLNLHSGGYFNTLAMPTDEIQNDIGRERADRVFTNTLDLQPDEYYFNTPTCGGMFVCNKVANQTNNNLITPVLIPYQDVKIQRNVENSAFIIYDASGNKYYFGNNCTQSISSSLYTDGKNIPQNWAANYSNAWYLEKIKNYNGILLFSFEYTSIPVSKSANSYACVNNVGNGSSQHVNSTSTFNTTQNTILLKKITSANGDYTLFTYVPRLDITADKALDNLTFYNYSNVVTKKVNFTYEYFFNPNNGKRLKLQKITEQNASGTNLQPIQFEYDNQAINNSNDQDQLGFYNGAGNSNTIPLTAYSVVHGNQYSDFAKKDLSFAQTSAASLKKIIYPDGGTKEFVFEQNDFSRDNDSFRIFKPEVDQSINYLLDNSSTFSRDNILCQVVQQNTIRKVRFTIPLSFLDHEQMPRITVNYTNNAVPNISCDNESDYTGDVTEFIYATAGSTLTFDLRCDNDDWDYVVLGHVNVKIEYKSYGIEQRIAKTGGLRIKKIITDDGDLDHTNNSTQYYTYKIPNDQFSRSSGYLLTHLKYNQYQVAAPGNGNQSHEIFTTLNQSISQAMDNKNGIVAYEYITEYNCDLDVYPNCKEDIGWTTTKLKYATYTETNDNNLPQSPNNTNFAGWRRNLPIEILNYKGNGDPASKVVNDYSYITQNTIYGRKLNIFESWADWTDDDNNQNDDIHVNNFNVMKDLLYSYNSEWVKPLSSTTTNYENGIGLNTTKNIIYSTNHKYPVEITSTYDDGSATRQKMKYVEDYATSSADYLSDQDVINNLKWYNVVGSPLYTTTEFKPVGSTIYKYTSANFTKLGIFDSFKHLPKETYSLDISTPITALTSPSINGNAFVIDPKLKLKSKVNSYYITPSATLPQVIEDELGLKKRVIYNSKLNAPVAEISFQESDFAAYTSYEFGNIPYNESASNSIVISANSQTIPNNAVTGLSYLQILSNNKITFSMPNGDYLLTFWSTIDPIITDDNLAANNVDIITTTKDEINRPKGWQYNQFLIKANGTGNNNNIYIGNGGSTISIDELRIYPKNATMNSTCYNATGQVISTCDINNNIVHTQYDSFNRIKCTKDRNGNIIKKYNYDDGDSDLFFNDPMSKTYYKNCPSGQVVKKSLEDFYPYPVNINAGSFTSQISKTEANYVANQNMTTTGETLATNCTLVCVTTAVCDATNGYKVIDNVCEQGLKVSTNNIVCCSEDKEKQEFYYQYSNSISSVFWGPCNINSPGCPCNGCPQ